MTDAEGRVSLPARAETQPLSVQLDGYEPTALTPGGDKNAAVAVALRPTTLQGVVADAVTGQPLPGVAVSLIPNPGSAVTTGADGSYRLIDVPPGARVHVDAGDYGTLEEEIGQRSQADFALKLALVTGQVIDGDGAPIQGAIVTAGAAQAVSGADGTYRLTQVPDGAEVVVAASGYLDARLPVSADRVVNAALEPLLIKAIYANGYSLSDPAEVERLIAQIDATELNALVIDLKQDTVYYDSQVPFFLDVEMVNPIYDLDVLVADLQARGIYVIGRMVIFQDPLVAEARPDLAVQDEVTGDIWRNDDGVGWVNAFEEELWQANIDLAVEAAGRGVDEIQYDYVRFPSDGDLSTADFGQEYTGEARQAAINEFLRRSHAALAPTGAKLAADIFGYTAFESNEQGIGQNFAEIVPLVDYVCMMIYPSHFIEGNIASAPGHPNDYPYETILESLQRSESMVPGAKLKFRPWLQAFSYPVAGLRPYGPEDIRAQIDAAEEFGASGWLLWNPANEYDDAVFKPA